MREDLPEEFIAEDDLILKLGRQSLLIGMPRIPDAGFAHEAEPCLMDDHGFLALGVSAEEDRRSKDPLESRYETPVLRSALLHPERVQHFSRAAEPNYSVLLTNREGGQKDRDEPVLAPRQSVRGVPGNLKQKMAVPSLVENLSRLRALYGQAAQHKGAGSKPKILARFPAFQADAGDGVSSAKFLFGDDQVTGKSPKDRPGRL
jgi:hypothetical protein